MGASSMAATVAILTVTVSITRISASALVMGQSTRHGGMEMSAGTFANTGSRGLYVHARRRLQV